MTEVLRSESADDRARITLPGLEYKLAHDGLKSILFHTSSEFQTLDDLSAKISLVPKNTRIIVEKVLEQEAETRSNPSQMKTPDNVRKNLIRKVDETHAIDVYYGRLNFFMDKVANEKRYVYSGIQMPAEGMDLRLLVYAPQKVKEQLHAVVYGTSDLEHASYHPAELPNDPVQMQGFFTVLQKTVESFIKVIPEPEVADKIVLDPFFERFNRRKK